MKTRYYQRTAYSLSDQPIPSCFIRLDEVFNVKLSNDPLSELHTSVVLAESLCSRMADIEMYAYLIADAGKRHSLDASQTDRTSDMNAAILTRAFTVGYAGACRALLDSAAVSLSTIYGLQVDRSEATFRSPEFWHNLVLRQPNVHRRYHGMRLFFTAITQWCDETPQQIPPISILLYHYGEYSRRETLIQVLEDRSVTLDQLAADAFRVRWINPLDLHRRWKPDLLTLCEKVCQDISDSL